MGVILKNKVTIFYGPRCSLRLFSRNSRGMKSVDNIITYTNCNWEKWLRIEKLNLSLNAPVDFSYSTTFYKSNNAIIDSKLRLLRWRKIEARSVGNMHQKFFEEISSQRDRQRDTQTYQSQYLRTIYGSLQCDECIICYTMLQITTGAIANFSTWISELWYICR